MSNIYQNSQQTLGGKGQKDCKSQWMWMGAVKCRSLCITQLLYTWIQRNCGYLNNICRNPSQLKLPGWKKGSQSLTSSWGGIKSWYCCKRENQFYFQYCPLIGCPIPSEWLYIEIPSGKKQNKRTKRMNLGEINM